MKHCKNDWDEIQKRESNWSISFHPEKCQLYRVSKKKKQIITEYLVQGKIPTQNNNAKYLGTIINDKLSDVTEQASLFYKCSNDSAWLPLLLSWALHSISYAALIKTCNSCPSCKASFRWPKGIFLHRPVYLLLQLLRSPTFDTFKNRLKTHLFL